MDRKDVSEYGLTTSYNNGIFLINPTNAIVKTECKKNSVLARTQKTRVKEGSSTISLAEQLKALPKTVVNLYLFSAQPLNDDQIKNLKKYGYKNIVGSKGLQENLTTPDSVNNSKEFITLVTKSNRIESHDSLLKKFLKSVEIHEGEQTIRNNKRFFNKFTDDHHRRLTKNQQDMINSFEKRFKSMKSFYCLINGSLSYIEKRKPEGKIGGYSGIGIYHNGKGFNLTPEGVFLLRGIKYWDFQQGKNLIYLVEKKL